MITRYEEKHAKYTAFAFKVLAMNVFNLSKHIDFKWTVDVKVCCRNILTY